MNPLLSITITLPFIQSSTFQLCIKSKSSPWSACCLFCALHSLSSFKIEIIAVPPLLLLLFVKCVNLTMYNVRHTNITKENYGPFIMSHSKKRRNFFNGVSDASFSSIYLLHFIVNKTGKSNWNNTNINVSLQSFPHQKVSLSLSHKISSHLMIQTVM